MASYKANVDKNGTIISYRFRVCVDRDDAGRQIWRTATIPRPENLTPKREEKEVKRLLDEWERKERDAYEQGVSADKGRITLVTFINGHWMPDHVLNGKHSANGREFFRHTSGTVIEYFGEKRKLVEVNAERIKKFLGWLRTEKHYSEATQQHVLHTLNNILNYAVRIDYLDRNPIDKLTDADKPSVIVKPVDFLSVDEAKAFLAALQDEELFWRAYFNLLLFGGLRRGEALGVKWSDYDAESKTILVSRNVTPDKESSSKKCIKTTKNGKARLVPITDGLAEMLEQRRSEVIELYGECKPDWFIFGTAADPSMPLYPTSPGTWLKRFEKRHGLREVGVHILRHSAGSLSLEAGANMKEVQMLLGHSSISVTSRHYIGLTKEAQRQTMEGLEKLLK